MGASRKNAHAPVIRGTLARGAPETCVRKNHVSRSVLDGQVPEIALPVYRFPVLFRTHDRHPCSKKLGALGATVDNYPNPLSLLKNSVPSLTGGKSFLSGGTGGSRFRKRPQVCSRSFVWCGCRSRGPVTAGHPVHDLCYFVTITNQAQRSQPVCGNTRYCQCQAGAVYSRRHGLCRASSSHDPAAHGPPSYGQSLGKPRP